MSPRCQECQDQRVPYTEAVDGSFRVDACRRCTGLAEVEWETLRRIREAGL